MSWLAAIILALLAFGLAIIAFRPARALWSGLAAALALGLAGYAWQASPGLAAAPATGTPGPDLEQFDAVAQRQEMIGSAERSRADLMFTADAMARRGQYENAAGFLNGITRENPRDFEAWLALGNVMVDHADGALTGPAVYAYRRASALDPAHPGPGYFVGVALIRQGRFAEARSIWTEALENAPEDAAGRAGLTERLVRLDEMLGAMAEMEAMQRGSVNIPPGGRPVQPVGPMPDAPAPEMP